MWQTLLLLLMQLTLLWQSQMKQLALLLLH